MATSFSCERLVCRNQATVYPNSIWFLFQSSGLPELPKCPVHPSNSSDRFLHHCSALPCSERPGLAHVGVWTFWQHVVASRLPYVLFPGLRGQRWPSWARPVSVGALIAQQQCGSGLDPVPWPSCVSWVSPSQIKTFIFKKITRQQPQNWSCSWREVSGRTQARLNAVPQQPRAGLLPSPLPCFFPEEWVS